MRLGILVASVRVNLKPFQKVLEGFAKALEENEERLKQLCEELKLIDDYYEPEHYSFTNIVTYRPYLNHIKVNTKGYYHNRYIRQKRFTRHHRRLPVEG